MIDLEKRMNIASESQEQQALVKWLNFHPKLKDHFLHIPNEGLRSKQTGSRLKREGMRAGVLDFLIYYPTTHYHGLWLEMKRAKRYSDSERKTPSWLAQLKFAEQVENVGYKAFFCYGWEDAKRVIEDYLSV